MKIRPGTDWATAPRTSPSCDTWRSTSCKRTQPRDLCAGSSSAPAGTTPTSPVCSPYSEVRLPCCFKDFTYATLGSWSRERRVIGKAEVTGGDANPRFVVTSLTSAEAKPRHLYEKVYCARGEMENRIKECQLDLFADRTSTATMQANQFRLWLASMAYVLLCALRRIGLAHTQFAEATCGTIRLKLLKLGALVRVSVRRIKIAMASACPWQNEFALAHARLRNAIA